MKKALIDQREYDLLRGIVRVVQYVNIFTMLDEDREIVDLLKKYLKEHDAKYRDVMAEIVDAEPAPKWREDETPEEFLARAPRVASGLMNVGMNGPRHGGIPTITGNLMCEGSETISRLLDMVQPI